jgi:hypothetical protein
MISQMRPGFRFSAGLAALLATGEALADATPAEIAAARQLGTEGVRLAEAGHCDQAIEKLARAEALYHAPTILGRLGECQVKLGRLVEGTENLQKVVRDPLDPKAPAAFFKAQERAKKVLDAALPRIGKLRIVVVAPPGTDVSVKVDGEPVSSAFLGTDRPTDPGEHFVEASAPGFLKSSETVELKDGGEATVTLKLKVDPEAPPPPPKKPDDHGPAQPPPPPPPSGIAPTTLVGITALGVGAVGLAVGTIFGVVAIDKKGQLDKRCQPANACPPGTQSLIDDANTMATVSTVGFVVGGIGLAAGVTLLLLPTGSGEAKVKAAATPVWLRPYVGAGELGVTGRF